MFPLTIKFGSTAKGNLKLYECHRITQTPGAGNSFIFTVTATDGSPTGQITYEHVDGEKLEQELQAATREHRAADLMVCGMSRAARLQQARIGEYIESEGGLFSGLWTPQDRAGESLSKTFNLFADVGDIADGQENTFIVAARYVGGWKNHRGHAGFNHLSPDKAPDEMLYAALRSDTYRGEWFIPPDDVLQTLYANKAAFKSDNAFVISSDGDTSSHTGWYASCTQHPHDASYIHTLEFEDGEDDWDKKDGEVLFTRCVRAVPVPP